MGVAYSQLADAASQQTQKRGPLLVQCRASLADGGTILIFFHTLYCGFHHETYICTSPYRTLAVDRAQCMVV